MIVYYMIFKNIFTRSDVFFTRLSRAVLHASGTLIQADCWNSLIRACNEWIKISRRSIHCLMKASEQMHQLIWVFAAGMSYDTFKSYRSFITYLSYIINGDDFRNDLRIVCILLSKHHIVGLYFCWRMGQYVNKSFLSLLSWQAK